MTYQHRIQESKGYEFVMGQHGGGRGKKLNSRKQRKLPPSGTIVPEIEDRSKTNGTNGESVTLEKGKGSEAVRTATTASFTRQQDSKLQDSIPDANSSGLISGSISTKSESQSAKNFKSAGQDTTQSVGLHGATLDDVVPPYVVPQYTDERLADESRAEQSFTAETECFGIGFRSISWTQVTGSYRRERSIEGLLVGSAVGDALGLAREGLSRRAALSMFGSSPLEYRLVPFVGVVSDDTHRMLMTMQAMLRSRSQLDHFRSNFAQRLRWYLLTAPISAGGATLVASLRLWMGVSPEGSGVPSEGNGPLIGALALATVLQGTGHSVERWVTASTKITHSTPGVTEAAILVAHAAHMALMIPKAEFDSNQVMGDLIALTEENALNALLSKLQEPLAKGYSVHRAAKVIGYETGVPGIANATAVMAVYSWLRHPNSYRKAVSAAIRAGGDSDTLGALVGGFAGVHLGVDAIPKHWVQGVSTWPQNLRWIDKLTGRLTDWPHGSEDLHKANALPVYPIRQLIRSAILFFAVGLSLGLRFPWQIRSWLERK